MLPQQTRSHGASRAYSRCVLRSIVLACLVAGAQGDDAIDGGDTTCPLGTYEGCDQDVEFCPPSVGNLNFGYNIVTDKRTLYPIFQQCTSGASAGEYMGSKVVAPDGYVFADSSATAVKDQSTELSDTSAYRLDRAAELGVSAVFGMFKASLKYEGVTTRSGDSEHVYGSSTRIIKKWDLNMIDYSGRSAIFTENFQTRYLQLPAESDELDATQHQQYKYFVDDFGTHFTTQATFGGTATLMGKMAAGTACSSESNNVAFEAKSKVAFLISAGAGASVGVASSECADEFESDNQMTVTGGSNKVVASPDDFEEWQKTIPTSPVIVERRLKDLSSLMAGQRKAHFERVLSDIYGIPINVTTESPDPPSPSPYVESCESYCERRNSYYTDDDNAWDGNYGFRSRRAESGPAGCSCSCFPASATVELEDGKRIPMAKLQIGDSVRVSPTEFSEVYMFTHQETDSINEFVKITIDGAAGAPLMLTDNHYLYVNGQLQAAKTVKVGDTVTLTSGLSAVVMISREKSIGLYNPHTLNGNIMVNDVLTSTFTSSSLPWLAHGALWPFRALHAVGLSANTTGLSGNWPTMQAVLAAARGLVGGDDYYEL